MTLQIPAPGFQVQFQVQRKVQEWEPLEQAIGEDFESSVAKERVADELVDANWWKPLHIGCNIFLILFNA